MDALIGSFVLPIEYDLTATFLFALTGALVAVEYKYDYLGLYAMALITGTGGALLRDGLFLQSGAPIVLTNPYYLFVVVIAGTIVLLFGWLIERLQDYYRIFFLVIDALGLGIYAVVGVQKTIAFGLTWPAAILIGVINAGGGGLLRDVISGRPPLIFQPGELYIGPVIIGSLLFVILALKMGMEAEDAAYCAIITTFLLRMLAIRLNWRSIPAGKTPFFLEIGKRKKKSE